MARRFKKTRIFIEEFHTDGETYFIKPTKCTTDIDSYTFDDDIIFKHFNKSIRIEEGFNNDTAKYIYEFAKRLNGRNYKPIEKDESSFKITKKDEKLDKSFDLIRSYIRGDFSDSLNLFKYFKDIATKSDKSITKLLEENGFNGLQIESSRDRNEINWSDLIEKLKEHKR